MPERYLHIRWPNGEQEQCYSPSSVVEQYLDEGKTYELSQFVSISESALTAASERVREKFGYSCSSAAHQLLKIKEKAATFDAGEKLEVVVEKIS